MHCVATLILCLACLPAFAAGFVPIDLPGAQLNALSADGRVASGSVVGSASGGFRSDPSGQAHELPDAVSAQGISASGRYIVGSALDAQQREVAAYWDEDDRVHRLGGLPGAVARAGVLSLGLAIDDELHVAGSANALDDHRVAFEWRPGDGMHRLAPLGGDDSAGVLGIGNGSGRTLGWSGRGAGTRRNVIWAARSARALDEPLGAAELTGGSRDAGTLLGLSAHARPFRWTEHAGLQPLLQETSTLPQPVRFSASSDDGSTLAGSAGSGAQRVAVIWTAVHGAERLDAWLARSGVAVPPGWTLIAASAVTADGTRIGGYGLHAGRFQSYLIDLPSAETAATASGDRATTLRRLLREAQP
jgi:uncharacterized membrane protein